MTRVATVDIGTNTLLLLVVEAAGDAVTVLDSASRFGRLGLGLDDTGVLADASIALSLDILRDYRARIDALGVDHVIAVGTQALREAGNAAAFRGPAEAILGVAIEVIGGEREAELVRVAVTRSLPDVATGELVIADVGGGSTEVIVVRDGELVTLTSVPIGSRRLTERHLKSDPPAAAEARALIEDIDAALAPLVLPASAAVVGSAGTATTMAAVELKLRSYDHDRVHGLRLATPIVERQLARYLELSLAERRELPGLAPQRADVIAAGAAIFARLLHRLAAAELRVSDRGVRWGLVYEALERAAD